MGKLEIDLKKKGGGGEWKQVTRTRENGINSDVLLCVLSGYKREGGFLGPHFNTFFLSYRALLHYFQTENKKGFPWKYPKKT